MNWIIPLLALLVIVSYLESEYRIKRLQDKILDLLEHHPDTYSEIVENDALSETQKIKVLNTKFGLGGLRAKNLIDLHRKK